MCQSMGKNKTFFQTIKFPLSAIITLLKSQEFILSLPLRIAGRPTYINLLIIEASVLIYSKVLMKYTYK